MKSSIERYKLLVKNLVDKKKYNIMEVPKIIKIVLNMSIGYKACNKKYFDECIEELKIITKQKPLIIKSKKSISNFKIRKGEKVSMKVTIRNKNIFYFIDSILKISKNRINDFCRFKKESFDYFGNYNFGVINHTYFPDLFKSKKIINPKGFNISINIKSKNVEDSYILLKKIGIIFE